MSTAAQPFEIKFDPNPVQKQFIESRARADLYSSRMGEGKSTALAWAALYHTRHNPGAKWVLVRDTFENLQATTQKTFFEWFPPGIAGEYHATKKEFTWASGLAEGTVGFIGMDDPQDAGKLQSRDFAGIGIDEPAPAVGSAGVDEMIFDVAISRLRQKGMNWYAMKLAVNNPDESHWTYRKFVTPGIEGFMLWQPTRPENEKNLPPEYYANLRKVWAHRPDLVRRFVDGEFGFQSEGKAVTPQWSDKLHLSHGLIPVLRVPLTLLWDWGHTPTVIVTQKTPMGSWLILDAYVGEHIGAEELIIDVVKPLLVQKYPRFPLQHTGDPTGENGEQTSIHRSAVKFMRNTLGGTWRPGPVRIHERVDPLQAVLTRTINGKGVVQVDKESAAPVWYALRGGWHYNVARSGVISGEPKKNMHSHPGDAMGYGAAMLFPMQKLDGNKRVFGGNSPRPAQYFEQRPFTIGPQNRHNLPKHGSRL